MSHTLLRLVHLLGQRYGSVSCHSRRTAPRTVVLIIGTGRRSVEVEVAQELLDLGPADALAAELARYADAALVPSVAPRGRDRTARRAAAR